MPAANVSGVQAAQHGILEHPLTDPLMLPALVGRQTCQHKRHRMARHPLDQAVGSIVVGNFTNDECVVTNNGVVREGDVGRRSIGKLILERVEDKNRLRSSCPQSNRSTAW